MNIAILEDLREVADSLKELFNEQDGISCNQVYYNAEDCLQFIPRNPADVLIVDIGLPGANGIEVIRQLSIAIPEMQYCMFTVYEDDEKIFQSLEAGAKGYILKGSDPFKIVEAVKELYQGGSPMSPSIARRILDVFVLNKIKPPVELPITQRERELLVHLSEGLLYKEIADKMNITTGTVKQTIHKIYGKLHVNNRTEAVNKLMSGK